LHPRQRKIDLWQKDKHVQSAEFEKDRSFNLYSWAKEGTLYIAPEEMTTQDIV